MNNDIDLCVITSVHSPADNRIYYKEMNALFKSGYSIALVAPEDWKNVDPHYFLYQLPRVRRRLIRFLYVSFFCVLKASLKIRAKIYHFHDPEIIPAALILKLLGKTVVYDAHEMFAESLMSKPYLKGYFVKKILSFVFGGIEQASVVFFNAVIAARPDVFNKFKNSKQIILLRNFPVIENLNSDIMPIEKKLPAAIYAGGLTPIRGIFELVEAFKNIQNGELWLLGEFSSSSFEEKCRSSSGWKKVRYFGKVPANQVLSYVKQADIGVITFLPEPNHLTTLATKPFEYMACGLPVLMSDFPYWRETFQDKAIYVDPSSSEDITFLLSDFFGNTFKYSDYGKRGKKLVEDECNWGTESLRLVELYKNLIMRS